MNIIERMLKEIDLSYTRINKDYYLLKQDDDGKTKYYNTRTKGFKSLYNYVELNFDSLRNKKYTDL